MKLEAVNVKELQQRKPARHRQHTEQSAVPGRRRYCRSLLLMATYTPLLVAATLYWLQHSKTSKGAGLPRTPHRVLREVAASGLGQEYQVGEGGCQKMIWLTGMAGKTAPDRVQYLQVALLSARQHAPSLVPVLIYSGEPDVVTSWFTANGGYVVHHTLSFLDEFLAQEDEQWREKLVRGQGIYLRLDIPEVMTKILAQEEVDMTDVSSEYVLYTDVDVMFGGDINTATQPLPRVLSLGPENVRGRAKNTGVILMNVTAFAAELPAMLDFGRERNFNFSIAMDQGLVLAYMNETGQEIGLLPDEYNWKGYFGESPAVRIFHFHGPKPNRCLPCYLQHRGRPFWQACADFPGRYPIGCSRNHLQLLRASPDRQGNLYLAMVRRFHEYVKAAGEPLDLGAEGMTERQKNATAAQLVAAAQRAAAARAKAAAAAARRKQGAAAARRQAAARQRIAAQQAAGRQRAAALRQAAARQKAVAAAVQRGRGPMRPQGALQQGGAAST